MSLIKSAQLNMSYDINNNPQMTYTVTYQDGGVANGTCSGQYAQHLVATFFPQAMADLSAGQQVGGDQGTGI